MYLLQSLGFDTIATEVRAEETIPGMVIGSDILGTDVNTNNAQFVYYAGRCWVVIAYNDTGNYALRMQDKDRISLFASDNVTDEYFFFGSNNVYATSILRNKAEEWYENNFDPKEKKAVAPKTLIVAAFGSSAANSSNGVSGSQVDNAYIWPLSTREFFTTGFASREFTYYSTPDKTIRQANGDYWLRSPGSASNHSPFAKADGSMGLAEIGGYSSSENDHCLRPAFNLYPSSILLTSVAEGGKISGDAGADALKPISDNTLKYYSNYTGRCWKLTLLDDGTIDGLDGHAGFTASRVGTGYVPVGGSIEIKYSGAKTDDNEYVSAFIRNSDGKVLYYGHLAQQTESSDGAKLNLPSDITPGEYTVGVFSEVCNGDYKTDYSSSIINIPITVVPHIHDFTYSPGSEDDTIIATCSNEDDRCGLDDGNGNHTISLKINLPERSVYDDTESASATLTGLEAFNNATGKNVSVSDIKYKGRDGTSYSESTSAPTDAGKYTASIAVEDVTAYVDYEIDKAAGSISYSDENVTKTFDLGDFTNPLSETGDGEVTYESSDTGVATVDGTGKVTFVKVGTVTITATVADSNNYVYANKTASYELTIDKGSGSLSYRETSINKTYGDEPFTNSLTKTGDGTVTYSSDNESVAIVDSEGKVTIVGVGTANITAATTDTDNCTYDNKEATYTLTVDKGNQTISAADMSLNYGEIGNVGATTSGEGTIGYAVKSGSEDYIDVDSTTGAVTVKSVPTDTSTKEYITVTAGSTDHYNEATKDVAVTINKANLTITAKEYSINIGDAIPDLTSTDCYEVDGLVGTDTLTTTPMLKYQKDGGDVTLPATATASNLGTYDIVPSGAGAGDNYKISYQNGRLTISKIIPTVTAPVAKELTYSGASQRLVTPGATSEGATMEYAISTDGSAAPTDGWSTDIPAQTDAKLYYVWYRINGNGTYEDIAPASVPVTISPKSIANAEVTLSGTEFEYDEQGHGVTVESVILDGVTLTTDTDYTISGSLSGTDVGTYTVTVTANNSNYTDSATATWSIGMSTPVINIQPASTPITYGQPLSDSPLSGGEASIPGTFTWKVPETIPSVSDSDTTTYEVVFTPDDAENYTTTSIRISVTVYKAESPSDNPAPTPKEELTDNGHPQELVNTVSVTGGTIEYVIGTDNSNPPTSGWSSSIPTASEPGTYYVWYKVVGDDNHTDTEPKVLKVEIIEKGETEIKTEVKKDDKSPEIKASNLTKDFAESTLTSEEKANIEDAISNGKDVDVDVYLEINGISDTISETDKDKIKAVAKNADNIEYFDISLFKEIIIGGQTLGATSIHNLTTPLKLTIGVPKSFPALADGYTRTYVVLRLHDGSVTVLPTTLNADGTLSFETDRFSIYALAYTDTKKEEAPTETPTTKVDTPTTEAPKADTPKAPTTGDKINIGVIVTLMIDSALAGLYLTLKRRLMK
ncbi:MAG: Ig-like domain-containing protein [Lachnospiraceae bacterium]|nr:Ig-like domain-containing protein [Lachnospiraceae bacterium]